MSVEFGLRELVFNNCRLEDDVKKKGNMQLEIFFLTAVFYFFRRLKFLCIVY